MNFLDKLQQAWQTQCTKPPDFNPDQLLRMARLQQRVYFWTDIFVVFVFAGVAVKMCRLAFEDIRQNWPWLIYVAGAAWVVGFIGFNRWRRRRKTARYDESMLVHVDHSITDLEHRMWMDRHSDWWYILPTALGCMIPTAIFFAMDLGERPLSETLWPFLAREAMFLLITVFVHLVLKFGHRANLERQHRELEGLRALREMLVREEAVD